MRPSRRMELRRAARDLASGVALSATVVGALLTVVVAASWLQGCASANVPGSAAAFPAATALQHSLEVAELTRARVRLAVIDMREAGQLSDVGRDAVLDEDRSVHQAVTVGHEMVGRYLSTGASSGELEDAKEIVDLAVGRLRAVAAAVGITLPDGGGGQ